jgi:hypothetical protein
MVSVGWLNQVHNTKSIFRISKIKIWSNRAQPASRVQWGEEWGGAQGNKALQRKYAGVRTLPGAGKLFGERVPLGVGEMYMARFDYIHFLLAAELH